jgi:hypothetical protein
MEEISHESIHGGGGRFGGRLAFSARRSRTGIGNVRADQSKKRPR